MEPELTLEKAVILAWQSECIKTQQPTVRGELFQESTVELECSQKHKAEFQGHRPTHLLKELGYVVGVESQDLTVNYNAQPETPSVTSVAKLDTLSLYVEA